MHERQKKIITKTEFHIWHICVYICIYIFIYLFIHIFFSFTPAYDRVPRTETASDPHNCHLMFPRNAILMWSPELPSSCGPYTCHRMFPRTAILMWSPQLPSHVVPRTDICMWSSPLTSRVVPRTDLHQFQVTTIIVDNGNGPSLVLSADSYGLLELVPVSRKRFPFPPFSSGNVILTYSMVQSPS